LFDRPHHRRIALVLQALDAERLAQCGCLFGGGTAMALRHGEYRESVDIDFLVSSTEGYRHLRQRVTGPDALNAITRPQQALVCSREVRADAYGLRTRVQMDGEDIKFEIVREARIMLAPPGPDDQVCGVAALTPLDMATTKLLALCDRWRDDATLSRDLIDLAMMAPPKPLLLAAIAKAETAYGDSVKIDLAKSIDDLRQRPHRLDICMQSMGMRTLSKAALWQRVRALSKAATIAP
jgi:Nucleotidyl transferase AbiEii toxin, Type IV TA system